MPDSEPRPRWCGQTAEPLVIGGHHECRHASRPMDRGCLSSLLSCCARRGRRHSRNRSFATRAGILGRTWDTVVSVHADTRLLRPSRSALSLPLSPPMTGARLGHPAERGPPKRMRLPAHRPLPSRPRTGSVELNENPIRAIARARGGGACPIAIGRVSHS